MKVLITGYFGDTGKRLSKYLNNFFELIVSDYRKSDKEIPYDFVMMDITKKDEVKERLKDIDIDAIVNLATAGCINFDKVTYGDTIKVNVSGTLNLLETAVEKNIKKFIYISSIRVYGLPTKETTIEYFPIDENHPRKDSHPYGLSKILAEDLCRGFARRNNISIICLRPGTITDVTSKGINYKELTTKQAIKDLKGMLYTHVDTRDLGQAIKLALESSLSGFEVFNIVSEDHILDIDSLDFIKKFYPNVKEIRNSDGFISGRRKSFIDISKAKKLLGYKPQYTYRRYLEWIKEGKKEEEYYKNIFET
jgi:nucleoside-diphosphate-sugar epimerase